jgi:HPr kinase/phosphorylase
LTVAVREFLDAAGPSLGLRLVAGARGLSRVVTVPRIQQPGLALAGFLPQLHADRIQVLGRSEVAYLGTLDPEAAERAVTGVATSGVACFVVTNGAAAPSVLSRVADVRDVPILATGLRTAEFIRAAAGWLEERLAPEVQLHGDLVEVHGVGILILGRSGIGKSEAALDLVSRGHRLVADDIVVVRRIAPTALRGEAATLLQHHMEIRGLGVIDVEALFGTLATLDRRELDLVVELIEWSHDIDRLGLGDDRHELLDVRLPLIRIPVTPGRSLATLIETAARNQLLRQRGRNSAVEFAARIDRITAGGRR